MSKESNNRGRAFEYITLRVLEKEIGAVRNVHIEKNSSYHAAKNAWDQVDGDMQLNLKRGAQAAVPAIFDLEPLILEDGKDTLDLEIQTDENGENGDVRDILIIRRNIRWEIGLSLKHNHFAVKHSRLAKGLDFGKKWYDIPCSSEYWNEVSPIFSYLEKEKSAEKKWREIPNKEKDVYIPLLKAFSSELKRSYEKSPTQLPRRMVEYLLGKYDFYKMIGIDAEETTQILTFNLRGSLNKDGQFKKAKKKIPTADLPTRIVSIEPKPGSNNTVEVYMDKGWQFSFRIHNASTKVETSLKFDIQLIGMPTAIISINCKWQ